MRADPRPYQRRQSACQGPWRALRSSRGSHTAPARRSPSAACRWRSAGRSRPFLWRLAGNDIAPASVMRRAPGDSDVTRPLRLSIILIYRKSLRCITNRLQRDFEPDAPDPRRGKCRVHRIQFEKKENKKEIRDFISVVSFSLWNEMWIETTKPEIIQQYQ